jgi:hypothetical protein
VKGKVSVVILIFCFVISGCASQRGWRYSAESKKIRQPLIDKSVAVTPFNDARADKNSNSLMMYLIPLVPFGSCNYSTPEGGSMKLTSTPVWNFKPVEDLAKAAAEELEASGLFKEVFFTQRASEGELVFAGKINSTGYSGKMISYGLSAYGPLLWYIGFPAGTVHNILAVEFNLLDQEGNVLWSNKYERRYDKSPFWLYALPSDFQYDNLYKGIMLDSIRDMEKGLSRAE